MRAAFHLLLPVVLGVSAFGQEHRITVQKFEPPKYPAIAKQAAVQGAVKLDLDVSSNGKVTSVRVISGAPILVQAATENVKKWQFACDGCSWEESFEHAMTYEFVLDTSGREWGWHVSYEFPDKVILVHHLYVEPYATGGFKCQRTLWERLTLKKKLCVYY